MKKQMAVLWILTLCLLTGCTSLLEREYSTSEPHSSKFWEGEKADILRAESHQDIVNDLLILVGEHTEEATLRLYGFEDDLTVTQMLEGAALEVQRETPLGTYAVEFITMTSQAQRGYYEARIQIGYCRSEEQLHGIVNTTSPEGIYSLMGEALDAGKTELAVRLGYWDREGRGKVETALERIREERGLEETPAWTVNYYPSEEWAGLVEILTEPREEMSPTED